MTSNVATTPDPGPLPLARAWDYLLAGRPLLALAIVWLTTAGHTMNFREMGASFGWVTIEAFSLHTSVSLLFRGLGGRVICSHPSGLRAGPGDAGRVPHRVEYGKRT